MTALVVHFPQPEGDGVVEMLERYLERAKAGEFSQMFIAYSDREGSSGAANTPLCSGSLLIGAIERGKFDLIKSLHSE